jgi:endonuclease/exonuclease/phosphatase family metal-dependent hydrolase
MGLHQALQSGATAKGNLDVVAALLDRQNADLVALQEVDGPSVWSGGFDHVDYLARASGYSSTVRGTHMKMPGLDYGTALLARYPMENALSVGFGHALSVTRKGFVVSEMQWPGTLDTKIDIVSLHLHPFRASARIKQINELVEILRDRGRPVIVMGDFNDDWRDDDTAARMLGSALGLSAKQPACEDCHTHRRMKNFVDWILISPELQFESFEILEDQVSDHFAIAATVRLRESPGTANQSL